MQKFKQNLAILLVVIMIITMIPQVAIANEIKNISGGLENVEEIEMESIDDIESTETDSSIINKNGFIIVDNVVCAYTGDETHIVIPEGVVAIADEAFYECRELISVVIPSSVTSIGNYAFYLCCGLKIINWG